MWHDRDENHKTQLDKQGDKTVREYDRIKKENEIKLPM